MRVMVEAEVGLWVRRARLIEGAEAALHPALVRERSRLEAFFFVLRR